MGYRLKRTPQTSAPILEKFVIPPPRSNTTTTTTYKKNIYKKKKKKKGGGLPIECRAAEAFENKITQISTKTRRDGIAPLRTDPSLDCSSQTAHSPQGARDQRRCPHFRSCRAPSRHSNWQTFRLSSPLSVTLRDTNEYRSKELKNALAMLHHPAPTPLLPPGCLRRSHGPFPFAHH